MAAQNPSLDAWRSLVDLDRLAAWMDDRGLEAGPIEEAARPPGGTQNILLKFRRGERWFMLRRPPLAAHMNGSETMRREARVLGALADTDVPHPRLIAAEAGEDVLGAAFYLMEPIEGFNATVGLPPLHAGSAQVRRGMGLSLVDGIAALGRVDHLAKGLGDFGRAEGFLERQVGRWKKQLASYQQYEGWAGPGEIEGVEDVGAWLEAHRPPTFKPGIIHGDYHLANVLFRFDGPELAAIVDWELTTIGDPLLDLGWLLATWPQPDAIATGAVSVTPWDGFPTADELVDRYAGQTDRDLTHMRWYGVLACYKLGIILEGTHARAAAGKAEKATGDALHNQTLGLFRRALGWIG
ncbi:MAG: phosphotransferase family protein [Phenylobacterium sp.]|uniref:phosphotransferase family protein n=1 Tax=Phenylobacterium sp. TaxID=1871053 RepID=UPI001A61342A|nr:phosphotransferase family protein [Phenylobacterium sp.]MBL8771423.1 phosphotransferase family protein [Phenylobacterium sp.]